MSNENNNQQLTTEESKEGLLCYKKNEANFNFAGVTLNIDIPQFINNVKEIKRKRAEQKAIKEMQKKQKGLYGTVECTIVNTEDENSIEKPVINKKEDNEND